MHGRLPALNRSRSPLSGGLRWLAEFPHIAPATDQPRVNELTMLRYPYKVYYEISGDEVWILHIRHTARQPWNDNS
jgi:plasmid stabilization system protein ParE